MLWTGYHEARWAEGQTWNVRYLAVTDLHSASVLTSELRFSDGTHTCYLLVGLSSAQHKWSFQAPVDDGMSSFGWTSEKYPRSQDEGYVQVFDEQDRVKSIHPVYVIPEGLPEKVIEYCSNQEQFS